MPRSIPRSHPNSHIPHHHPPLPIHLFCPWKQQRHLQHRPLEFLQRRQRLQHRRRRPPRLRLKLGRPNILVLRRCPPARFPRPHPTPHQRSRARAKRLDCQRARTSLETRCKGEEGCGEEARCQGLETACKSVDHVYEWSNCGSYVGLYGT